MMKMLHKIESWKNIKVGDVLVVKSRARLILEGWEPIAWGLIKHRARVISQAYLEQNYYVGMEKDLGPDRLVTLIDKGCLGGGDLDIAVAETPYHIAKDAILGVVREVAA